MAKKLWNGTIQSVVTHRKISTIVIGLELSQLFISYIFFKHFFLSAQRLFSVSHPEILVRPTSKLQGGTTANDVTYV